MGQNLISPTSCRSDLTCGRGCTSASHLTQHGDHWTLEHHTELANGPKWCFEELPIRWWFLQGTAAQSSSLWGNYSCSQFDCISLCPIPDVTHDTMCRTGEHGLEEMTSQAKLRPKPGQIWPTGQRFANPAVAQWDYFSDFAGILS